ncbi:DUF5359 family protein [Pullulanibacillus sp. KACC 23026]|uniref:DUF5359 family protein n=1 Tax=Pullulanibacillus sp. KACC 23026 TaxID=3028315 RepID=UPI0023B13887|nr:DUF5359 family protein [Pullulanibacillus sp. KACC 23026]WEG11393.1 DUF5359 family protein [Pullulanibacillus sp. KACC 23026]
MKQDWTKSVERWLLRLVVIQGIVLIIGQILIGHQTWTPFLNRAVQDEGVLKNTHSDTVKTMEQSPAVWYDKQANKSAQ